MVDVQNPQTADEHGHLGRRQRQQLRLVDEQFFGRDGTAGLLVIAETVRERFQHGKGIDVRLFL